MQALIEHPDVAPVVAFLTSHVLVVPALLVLGVAAVVLAAPVARRLGSTRPAAALLLLACTAPLAMTLPPSGLAVDDDATRRCLGLRPLAEWGRGGEELSNALLTLPAGLLLVALLPRVAVGPALLVAAGFPLLVEGVQYAVPGLGRTCEVTDVLLNLVGLAVGAGIGLLLRPVVHAGRPRRALRSGPPAPGPLPSASPGTSARP